ncbi:MAG: hypothetical protein ACP5GS_08600 [Nitrososphaeria archaeon]
MVEKTDVPVIDTEQLLAEKKGTNKSDGNRKMSYRDRQQHFQERKEELAKREETRVVYARTQDIRGLISVISIGDVALRRLRDGFGIRYDVNEATDKIANFNKVSKDLVKVVADICKTVGLDFKLPKWASDYQADAEEEKSNKPTV